MVAHESTVCQCDAKRLCLSPRSTLESSVLLVPVVPDIGALGTIRISPRPRPRQDVVRVHPAIALKEIILVTFEYSIYKQSSFPVVLPQFRFHQVSTFSTRTTVSM